MNVVASRDLRNRTRALLSRVEEGETLTISVSGRPVAVLGPLPDDRPRWITKDDFLRWLEDGQADPGLRDDLKRLAPDTTDDLKL